ncbi:MAG: alpha/beta hydrolase [Actinomycetota bacterium]
MKERRYLATWRTTKAEQRYRELDGELWQRDLTGPPPEAIDVPTGFGLTRVYRWAGTGPPIVFLHGMGDTSVRWIPYAEHLDGHDVYAVDIMGDVGASQPTSGFTSAADYPDWLHQTVTGLGLDAPTVVGESLGGYVALSYAIAHPVAATVVFDPVGVVKLRLMRFMAMGAWGLLGMAAPDRVRRGIGRRFHQPLLADKQALRLFGHGQRHHPPKLPPLPVFSDDELASIATPLRVVVGARTTVFDVEKLIERVNTVVPGGEARLLPDAAHGFSMTHVDECLAAIHSAPAS